jgi:hypothetical protein
LIKPKMALGSTEGKPSVGGAAPKPPLFHK